MKLNRAKIIVKEPRYLEALETIAEAEAVEVLEETVKDETPVEEIVEEIVEETIEDAPEDED